MAKKAPARNRAGNPDFTFKDLNRAGIRFNSKAFIEIEYEADSEDVTITKTDEIGETVKTIVSNFDSPGGSVLGTKTITENGTYNASADELDGYSSVTVNVEAAGGITPDDIATKTKPSGAIIITNAVSAISSRAFENYKNITSVTILGDPFIGTYAFNGCSNIESVNVPDLTTLKAGYYDSTTAVFSGCSKLQGVVFPKLTGNVNSYMFNNCTLLTYADFNNISGITGADVFNNTSINLLIIRKTDAVATLANVNNFANTPIAATGTGGDIYVPSNLLSQYEQATNWSALNATFKAIEGSYYETHYADGTEVTP